MNDTDCVFCKIIAGTIPAGIVYEDDLCIAFNDINPRAPFHALFVPRRHIAKVADVNDADESLLGHLINAARKQARARGIEHFRLQFNNGERGGQEVFHLHLHLLGW